LSAGAAVGLAPFGPGHGAAGPGLALAKDWPKERVSVTARCGKDIVQRKRAPGQGRRF
jgi:hypothetical protein